METDKGHTAEYESPELCVVDLPKIEKEDSDFLRCVAELRRESHGARLQGYRKKINCACKYIGVTKSGRKKNRWRAAIKCNYQWYSLGHYENRKDAARAYDMAAMRLYGRYANTNQMMYPEDFKDTPRSKTSI